MKFQAPINDPKVRNRFCGPAVVSSLTGMTTGEAARLFRVTSRRRRTMVKGTTTGEMRSALQECGLSLLSIPVCAKMITTADNAVKSIFPTFATWIKESAKDRGGDTYLVVSANHWQLVRGSRFVCGITQEVVGFKHPKVKRRGRVTEVYRIIEKIATKIPDKARAPVATKPEGYEPRKKLAKLERQHGFKAKVVRDGGYTDVVIEPTSFWPEGLSTYHMDWWETLDRIEKCLENPLLVDGGWYSE